MYSAGTISTQVMIGNTKSYSIVPGLHACLASARPDPGLVSHNLLQKHEHEPA